MTLSCLAHHITRPKSLRPGQFVIHAGITIALSTWGPLSASGQVIHVASTGDARIQRVSFDCSLLGETLVEDVGDTPVGIALDGDNGKIYWTDTFGQRLMRANLDGSGSEVFLQTGICEPSAIAIDEAAGHIYWSDLCQDTVSRIKIDGTGRMEILTGTQTYGIAIDSIGGRMYWTSALGSTIFQANLDGTDPSPLVTNAGIAPVGIDVDAESGMVFWTDFVTNVVRAFALSGNGTVSNIVTNASGPTGIAVDPSEQKVYWSNNMNGQIQRANYDGTEKETLAIQGVMDPFGLAVVSKASYEDGDMNHDGVVDGQDIPLFVQKLLGLGE